MVRSIGSAKMIRRGVAKVLIILLVVVVATAVGTYLVTWYVNTFGTVRTDEGVIGYVSETFSGSTDAGTVTVTLDNGYKADVPWDGKAVGVLALAGRYIEIEGNRYWNTYSVGWGKATSGGCPWYAFLTGATVYDVRLRNHDARRVSAGGPGWVEVAYDSQLESGLKAQGIQFAIVSTSSGRVIRIPVYGRTYILYAEFDFYYGSTGIFGGCPQPRYSHTSVKSRPISFGTTFP